MREIISLLQTNKDRNAPVWLAYFSWVEIKQQLLKGLANLTSQEQRCLRSTVVAHKCKVVTWLLLNCCWFCSGAFSKVNAKWEDQVMPAVHARILHAPGAGLWGWLQQHSSPLARGSSGRADKAGWAQGAHQLLQLCLLIWQKVNWSMQLTAFHIFANTVEPVYSINKMENLTETTSYSLCQVKKRRILFKSVSFAELQSLPEVQAVKRSQ